MDLPPQDVRPAIARRLEEEILLRRRGHIHAGITGGAFLYKTLLALDRQDLLFAMANKGTYPGWGDMLRHGATSLYESWDMDNSLCHSSYLYIGTWFIEGLAGIKTDLEHPGFKHFVLKPGLVDDPSLTWVRAHHDCIHGRITSHWQRADNLDFAWEVSVPPNTTATVILPATDVNTATEGGRPIAESPGLKQINHTADQLILEVQPGRYHFQSKLPTR